jgi:hypothetical protein
VNAYSSLDGGEDIVFTRLSYAAGPDTFCLWHAAFAGDDRERRGCRVPRPARTRTPDDGQVHD